MTLAKLPHLTLEEESLLALFAAVEQYDWGRAKSIFAEVDVLKLRLPLEKEFLSASLGVHVDFFYLTFYSICKAANAYHPFYVRDKIHWSNSKKTSKAQEEIIQLIFEHANKHHIVLGLNCPLQTAHFSTLKKFNMAFFIGKFNKETNHRETWEDISPFELALRWMSAPIVELFLDHADKNHFVLKRMDNPRTCDIHPILISMVKFQPARLFYRIIDKISPEEFFHLINNGLTYYPSPNENEMQIIANFFTICPSEKLYSQISACENPRSFLFLFAKFGYIRAFKTCVQFQLENAEEKILLKTLTQAWMFAVNTKNFHIADYLMQFFQNKHGKCTLKVDATLWRDYLNHVAKLREQYPEEFKEIKGGALHVPDQFKIIKDNKSLPPVLWNIVFEYLEDLLLSFSLSLLDAEAIVLGFKTFQKIVKELLGNTDAFKMVATQKNYVFFNFLRKKKPGGNKDMGLLTQEEMTKALQDILQKDGVFDCLQNRFKQGDHKLKQLPVSYYDTLKTLTVADPGHMDKYRKKKIFAFDLFRSTLLEWTPPLEPMSTSALPVCENPSPPSSPALPHPVPATPCVLADSFTNHQSNFPLPCYYSEYDPSFGFFFSYAPATLIPALPMPTQSLRDLRPSNTSISSLPGSNSATFFSSTKSAPTLTQAVNPKQKAEKRPLKTVTCSVFAEEPSPKKPMRTDPVVKENSDQCDPIKKFAALVELEEWRYEALAFEG